MKRMVKNGDLIDVEPDGTITVAGKPIGGGSSNDREITLTMPYPSGDTTSDKKLYIEEEIWNKIQNCYYETIKIYYNDGNPIGVFNVLNFYDSYNRVDSKEYCIVSYHSASTGTGAWYGSYKSYWFFARLVLKSDSAGKYLVIQETETINHPTLVQSKFDALYKLADKPTQNGTYVLKATVSDGAVSYTWVAQ